MKTIEEKKYHAAYIVYEQAMLHIHTLTLDMKDRAEASLIYFNIMNSLKRSVNDAIKEEKKSIEDAYDWGLAFGLDWGMDEKDEPKFENGEQYYESTYGTNSN